MLAELTTLVVLLCVFIFTVNLLHRYPHPKTHASVYILVFLGWFNSFVIITLIPYDIYLTSSSTSYSLIPAWIILYWSIFIICWIILPILNSYYRSGEFSTGQKFKDALKTEAKFVLIIATAFAGFIIYLLIINQMTLSNIPEIFVLLSNLWGLFLLVMLLGYGLVSIPMILWRKGDLLGTLRTFQIQAANLESKRMRVRTELQKCVNQALRMEREVKEDCKIAQELMILMEECGREGECGHEEVVINHKELVKLHKRVKNLKFEEQRNECVWMNLMMDAHALEDVVVAKKRGKWVIKSNLWTQKLGKHRKMKEKMEFLVEVYLKPVGFRILGVVCAGLSCVILFGEATLYLEQDVSPLRMVFKNSYGVLPDEILILIPLIYIIIASHMPLFEIRLEGLYGLYKNKNTQPSSLIYSACILARLMPIVTYNFLMLIGNKDTQFMEVMDWLQFMPYVCEQYFNYFPILLTLLCILHGFNLYNKFVRAIGLEKFAFAEELKNEREVEGRMLIAKDRQERERSLRHSKVDEEKSRLASLLAGYERNFSLVSSVNSIEQ